jgi:hypothetical protein
MSEIESRDYFTVETTAMQIQQRGALAIYAGDKPKLHADGSRTFTLRCPLLIMPQEMWGEPEKLMEKIARILNEHAAEFFSSAVKETE